MGLSLFTNRIAGKVVGYGSYLERFCRHLFLPSSWPALLWICLGQLVDECCKAADEFGYRWAFCKNLSPNGVVTCHECTCRYLNISAFSCCDTSL